MVETTASGDIFNEVHADSPTPDPDGTNNSDTVIIPVEEAADISVIKTSDTDYINEGGTLIYTILISNDGPSTAENVRLTDAVSSTIGECGIFGGWPKYLVSLEWLLCYRDYGCGKVQSVFIRGNVRLGISGSSQTQL